MAEGPTTAKALDSLIPGDDVGFSKWITIDQALISAFGEVTMDPDPMHIDPAWAADHSPFGQTVAFGFLTVSLLTHLLHDASRSSWAADPDTQGYYLNYGFDRLRLIAPVRVGSRIRGQFQVLDRQIDEKGRHTVKFGAEIEIEGEARPAMVAEWLTVWVPPQAA